MKFRTSTLDRIAAAYAEAVSVGDFASAEGWLATASFVADRESDHGSSRGSARDLRTGVLTRPRRTAHH